MTGWRMAVFVYLGAILIASFGKNVRDLNFFFTSRRRHTRWNCDWSSDVCSSDLAGRDSRLLGERRRDPESEAIPPFLDLGPHLILRVYTLSILTEAGRVHCHGTDSLYDGKLRSVG